MKIIEPGVGERHLEEAVKRFRSARLAVALTGAGISVASGIPDFRSPGGLWSRYSPDEYATLEVFQREPGKAWQLYRAVGEILDGKEPNAAHYALARLEWLGMLHAIVTQNVDMLHQLAGSENVLEIHGEHRHLQCLRCGELEPGEQRHYRSGQPPLCRKCGVVLKPNVVLFGEEVRRLEEIHLLLQDCDLLLVAGTSARVYPAAGLPLMVRRNRGLVYVFDREETELTRPGVMQESQTDYFFRGPAEVTLDLFCRAVAGECP
jgi:NAD-dependent deacetylase